MHMRWTTTVVPALLLAFAWSPNAMGQGRPASRGGAFGGQPRPQPASRPPNSPNLPHVQAPAPNPRPAPQPQRPNIPNPGLQNRPGPVNPPTVRPTPRPAPNPVTPTRPPVVTRPPGGAIKPSPQPIQPSRPPVVTNPRPNPGPGGSFPSLGGNPRPNRPSPGTGVGQIPRPNNPNIPGTPRPRPTPGDVGGFLGMQKPIRPTPGGGGIVARPPGAARPPVNVNRPVFNRPINVTQNTVINSRPSWVNVNQSHFTAINNNWHGAIIRPPVRPGVGLQDWNRYHPNRVAYWNGWGNSVRNNWSHYNYHGSWFNSSWWGSHIHPYAGWHYSYAFNRYPFSYWWRTPAWPALTSWFAWTPPANVWAQPIYYDYGPEGNVVYHGNSVFVGGQDVGSASDFAQSAAALATVPPPPDETQAAQAEWMPLGTFALSSNENDTQPQRIVQLAVDKQGVISGTWYNQKTDKTSTIQGQVDKETQRVAFRIGDNEQIVAETGLYNLTQNEAPLMVHYGPDKVENYLLVRLDAPPDDAAGQQGQ